MTSIQPSDLSILLVEPSDTQSKIIINHLKRHEITQITLAKSLDDAREAIERHHHDLIASAMYFDNGTALDLLKDVKKISPKNQESAFYVSLERIQTRKLRRV